jgi:hypothetical protein
MGIRTISFVVRVGDDDPSRVPTPEECFALLGISSWDMLRNRARGQGGQYLVGYRTDLGRRGDERDARGAAHIDDTGFKGRPANERDPQGGGRR